MSKSYYGPYTPEWFNDILRNLYNKEVGYDRFYVPASKTYLTALTIKHGHGIICKECVPQHIQFYRDQAQRGMAMEQMYYRVYSHYKDTHQDLLVLWSLAK